METLKPKEVAKRLNISVKTLQKWDNENIFKSHKTMTGRRYYLPDEVDKFEKKYFGM